MIATFIYPFLFSVFPVLTLYLENYTEVALLEVLFTLLVILFITACIYVGSLIVVGDTRKASVLTFIFLFYIFSFGPFLNFLEESLGSDYLLSTYSGSMALWALAFLACVFIALLASKKVKIISDFLFLSTVFLLATTIIGLFLRKPWLNLDVLSMQDEEIMPTSFYGSNKDKDLPDIYYIIIDRYLGNEILKKNYNFDNSEFLSFLKSKGFYVVEDGQANYIKTAHSLASSLNMNYIDQLLGEEEKEPNNWMPLYKLIEGNKVSKVLKKLGYEYVLLGSWWEPTRKSEIADKNVNLNIMSEFSVNLLKNTIFYPFYNQIFSESARMREPDRNNYQIEYIKSSPHNESPTFVFAHFLITHPPYLFDEDGNLLNSSDYQKMTEKEMYITQIKYANKLLRALAEELLLENGSSVKPVIVFQSDEGKFPADIIDFDHEYCWFDVPDEIVEERLSILNAIYIPGLEEGVLYQSITPVNTFRIIFNELFNANLNILPDESYLHQNNSNIYMFNKIK